MLVMALTHAQTSDMTRVSILGSVSCRQHMGAASILQHNNCIKQDQFHSSFAMSIIII